MMAGRCAELAVADPFEAEWEWLGSPRAEGISQTRGLFRLSNTTRIAAGLEALSKLRRASESGLSSN